MKKALWLRIKEYQFDDLVPSQLRDHVMAMFGGPDASTQAFASKLSRKLGWSRSFALRAVDEYRKFVYLGVVSEFPVTPPKIIDQVWHEHLLFSRGYRDFCREVLRRDFDHNPELVPVGDQTEAFHAQYAATLELYREEFSVTPPAAIWGTPKFSLSDTSKRIAKPHKKPADSRSTSDSDDHGPLYLMFDTADASDGGSYHTMPEFGGGGGFSGGGGESSWGDSGSDSGSDSGGGGGDGGGGSGCSSGCGGGGE